MVLSDEQARRYNRHILIRDIGLKGQQRISEARVLVIGAGGLGSPALFYLAAAGVGTIGIADSDVVDLTNLQRQIIHFTDDLNKPKTQSAREKIGRINPDVRVNTHSDFVTSKNILGLIREYDFIIDGTDNFSSKFLINDACVISGKPFSHAGVLVFDGQMMTIVPKMTACLRCIFPKPPPPDMEQGSDQVGVLGSLAGAFGTLQATEALKYIIQKGELLTNRLLIYNALELTFREVKLKKRTACPVCGENPKILTLTDYDKTIGSL
jgi:molybdopterin/thiamine biosynthesis adenylyltransferase